MNRMMLTLVLAAPAALAQPAHDDQDHPDYQREIDQSYEIRRGQEIEIHHAMGDVEVTGSEGNQVRVWARIEAKGERASEFGDHVNVEVHPDGGRFLVQTHYPDGNWQNLSYGVTLRISLPRGHAVDAHAAFGNASLTGIEARTKAEVSNGGVRAHGIVGALALDCSFGAIAVQSCRGPVTLKGSSGKIDVSEIDGGDLKLECAFGDVSVQHVRGAATLACSNGKVALLEVTGRASVRAQFGDVRVGKIGGPLQLSSSNGALEVAGVGATAEIEHAFGDLIVSDVGGNLKLESHNGGATVKQVRGAVEMDSAFGSVSATSIGGTLRLKGSNGAVEASRIDGDVTIDYSFGPITLERLRGNVSVKASNGPVSARGLSYQRGDNGGGNRIDVDATMGPIDLVLPEPPSFRLDAAATFGDIRSDFELQGVERSETSAKCRCTVGEGKAAIQLRSSNGSIQLLSEQSARRPSAHDRLVEVGQR